METIILDADIQKATPFVIINVVIISLHLAAVMLTAASLTTGTADVSELFQDRCCVQVVISLRS
jgi:hypothetical protein